MILYFWIKIFINYVMYLKIKKIDNTILLDSEKYYGDSFCDFLKKEKPWTYKESLVARYLIAQNKKTFSSISHKKDLVFIWTSDNKIGVDIEILKERDINLLDSFDEEYNMLWWKNWHNFYILWTAKESIIKYNLWRLDDISEIKLIKTKINIKNILNLNFSYELVFKFNWKKYIVFNWNVEEIYFSICL